MTNVFSMVFIRPEQNRILLVVKDNEDLRGAVGFAHGEIAKTGENPEDWKMVVSNVFRVDQEKEVKPFALKTVAEYRKDLSVKNKLFKEIIQKKDKKLMNRLSFMFNEIELNFLKEEIKK